MRIPIFMHVAIGMLCAGFIMQSIDEQRLRQAMDIATYGGVVDYNGRKIAFNPPWAATRAVYKPLPVSYENAKQNANPWGTWSNGKKSCIKNTLTDEQKCLSKVTGKEYAAGE